jgi:hypothetical protein
MATDYHTAELTVMFDGQFFCPDRLFGGEGMDLQNVIRDFLVLEIILTVMVANSPRRFLQTSSSEARCVSCLLRGVCYYNHTVIPGSVPAPAGYPGQLAGIVLPCAACFSWQIPPKDCIMVKL